jgi:hypothetical protein
LKNPIVAKTTTVAARGEAGGAKPISTPTIS